MYNLSTISWSPNGLISEKTYVYGDSDWKDKLTSYNGTIFTYDEVGNPENYRDGMIFDWITGRSLSKITKGNTELEMMYDCNGMRTQKGIGDDVTKYYYDSSNNLIGLTYGNNTLFFYYDNNGTPTSFAHNGTMYYYVKNLQGDIVQITKQDGTVVAKYIYDVWGKILSIKDGSNNIIETTNATHLANLNPFRYRGYVYDNETGLYYLQSRYYDPITGRFLNADVYCNTGNSVLSTNMFTYCNNNPVNQVDPEGTDAMWLQFSDAVKGLGHTSLLVRDKSNVWWYLYWGPKHVILRPCGTSNFSLSEINAYLIAGFDPRPHHNYYVYSYNGIDDDKISNLNPNGKEINGKAVRLTGDENYYYKMYDGQIKKCLYINGDFHKSYDFILRLIQVLYYSSNANNLYDTFYENGKKIIAYHVCHKQAVVIRYRDNNNKLIEEYYEYFDDLEKDTNTDFIQFEGYHLLFCNCVQVSILALIEGEFSEFDFINDLSLSLSSGYIIPNTIYNQIWYKFKEEKL